MERTKVVRGLRFAWTAWWGIVCVLLVVLWVRSFFRFDQFIRPVSTSDYYACTSAQGRILLGKSNDPMLSTVFGTGWTRREFSLNNWDEATNIAFFPASVSKSNPGLLPWLRFRKNFYIQTGTSSEVILPYWMLIGLFAALATAPWIPSSKRFSLRALLIATTLIAVVLGLVVWSIRS